MVQTTGGVVESSEAVRVTADCQVTVGYQIAGINLCPWQDNVPGRPRRMPLSGRQPSAVVWHLGEPTGHTSAFGCGMLGEDLGTLRRSVWRIARVGEDSVIRPVGNRKDLPDRHTFGWTVSTVVGRCGQ